MKPEHPAKLRNCLIQDYDHGFVLHLKMRPIPALCGQRQLDPVATYAELAARYEAPALRGPFNLAARRAAGFDEAELARLGT